MKKIEQQLAQSKTKADESKNKSIELFNTIKQKHKIQTEDLSSKINNLLAEV